MAKKKTNPATVLKALRGWLEGEREEATHDGHSYAVESLVSEFGEGHVHEEAARTAHERFGRKQCFSDVLLKISVLQSDGRE